MWNSFFCFTKKTKTKTKTKKPFLSLTFSIWHLSLSLSLSLIQIGLQRNPHHQYPSVCWVTSDKYHEGLCLCESLLLSILQICRNKKSHVELGGGDDRLFYVVSTVSKLETLLLFVLAVCVCNKIYVRYQFVIIPSACSVLIQPVCVCACALLTFC